MNVQLTCQVCGQPGTPSRPVVRFDNSFSLGPLIAHNSCLASPQNSTYQGVLSPMPDKPKPLSDEEIIERMDTAIYETAPGIHANIEFLADAIFAAIRAYEAATRGE